VMILLLIQFFAFYHLNQ